MTQAIIAALRILPQTGKITRTAMQKDAIIPKGMSGSQWSTWRKANDIDKDVDASVIAALIARLSNDGAPPPPPAPVPVPQPGPAPSPVAPTAPAPAPAAETWKSVPDATSVVVNGVKLGAQCPGKPYSLQISSTGEERYEIRADEHCSNDGKGTDKRRSELSGLTTRDQGLISFEFDILIEEAPFGDNVQYVFGQLHKGKAANGIKGDHPPLAFRIVRGGFPGFTVCGSNAYPLTKADIDAAPSVTAWVGKKRFPFGKRVHVKIVAMQGGAEQWAELWLDGELMVRHAPKPGQAIGYKNPEAPPYWKRGIYNAQKSAQTCVAHYWNVKAG